MPRPSKSFKPTPHRGIGHVPRLRYRASSAPLWGRLAQALGPMRQIVEGMNSEEIARLEAQRSWVRERYEPHARTKYDTVDGKLALLAEILKNGWIESSETVKLQSLGIAFGDALSQELGLRWVTVEDKYGRDPALELDGTSILTFPLTSISKRIERGESVDVYALFASACSTIRQAAQGGA